MLRIQYDKLENGIWWLVSALRHEFSSLCGSTRKPRRAFQPRVPIAVHAEQDSHATAVLSMLNSSLRTVYSLFVFGEVI